MANHYPQRLAVIAGDRMVEKVCSHCHGKIGEKKCRYSDEPIRELKADESHEGIWNCHLHLKRAEEHDKIAETHESEEYHH